MFPKRLLMGAKLARGGLKDQASACEVLPPFVGCRSTHRISRETAAMVLRLYYHPFASFCQKVLIALYENGTAFEPELVDLGNPDSRAAFAAVWPLSKFP